MAEKKPIKVTRDETACSVEGCTCNQYEQPADATAGSRCATCGHGESKHTGK